MPWLMLLVPGLHTILAKTKIAIEFVLKTVMTKVFQDNLGEKNENFCL